MRFFQQESMVLSEGVLMVEFTSFKCTYYKRICLFILTFLEIGGLSLVIFISTEIHTSANYIRNDFIFNFFFHSHITNWLHIVSKNGFMEYQVPIKYGSNINR